jgi:hypothetical protein
MKDHAMAEETLTRVRLQGGRYEGLYAGAAEAALEAVHEGKVVAVAQVTQDETAPGRFRVAIDLPASVIGEGVQVITLRSTVSGAALDRITLMSGAPLDEDIRAEVALLRDELEMLKRAFRRHCSETGAR